MRYAIIENGIVVNVVEWDGGQSSWSPPEGTELQSSDTANPDNIWDGHEFRTPEPAAAG